MVGRIDDDAVMMMIEVMTLIVLFCTGRHVVHGACYST